MRLPFEVAEFAQTQTAQVGSSHRADRRGSVPKVREAIRLLEREGWQLSRTRGSHRIFKHPDKPGIVVVAGKPGIDIPRGTWNSILRQAGLK